MSITRSWVSRVRQLGLTARRLQRTPPSARGLVATARNGDTGVLSARASTSTPFLPPVQKNCIDNYPLELAAKARGLLPEDHPSIPFVSLVTSITETLTNGYHSHSYTISHLISLLKVYASQPSHWQMYAHANTTKAYTRNLICEAPGIFHLLLLVWTPGKTSAVHDHAGADCLMKVLQGELLETRFAFPEPPGHEEGQLHETSREVNQLNSISYMTDELGLHSVANPSQAGFAVSLHLYTPPNVSMRGCHTYNPQNGQEKHVVQGPYDSVGGVLQFVEG